MARILTPQEVEEIIQNAGRGPLEPMEQEVSEPGVSGDEPPFPEGGQTAAELLGVEPAEPRQEDDGETG
jgi:hypothetical protein